MVKNKRKKISKKIGPKVRPISVSPGTVWYGGPFDRCKASLRISSDNLDPDKISTILACIPTRTSRNRISKIGATGVRRTSSSWILELTSEETGITDIEELILELFKRVPSSKELWLDLSRNSNMDVFCGLFMEANNRGFGLKPSTTKALAQRSLAVSFDIYALDGRSNAETRV